jgi:hypothetical protein
MAVRQTKSINDGTLARQTATMGWANNNRRAATAIFILSARLHRGFQRGLEDEIRKIIHGEASADFLVRTTRKKLCTQKPARAVADSHESAMGLGLSRTRDIAPRALQLHFSYLTEALSQLLNEKVRHKFFVRSFPQSEKFCASMPICSGVRGNST